MKIVRSFFAHDGKIWQNPQQIAELFGTSKPNISMYISNILRGNELSEDSGVQNYLTTTADGKHYKAKAGRQMDLAALEDLYTIKL